jgi:putative ABC transport system permease protein
VAVLLTAVWTQLPMWAVLQPGNLAVPLGAFVFGVLVALVGGLYPAYRAAWEPPVEALRG